MSAWFFRLRKGVLSMALIDVEKLCEKYELRKPFGYELARRLPPGVRVELGRKVRISEEKFDEWIAQGGTLSNKNQPNGDRKSEAA
jgi:hypothetical protein